MQIKNGFRWSGGGRDHLSGNLVDPKGLDLSARELSKQLFHRNGGQKLQISSHCLWGVRGVKERLASQTKNGIPEFGLQARHWSSALHFFLTSMAISRPLSLRFTF